MYRHFIEITGLVFLGLVALGLLLIVGALLEDVFVEITRTPILTLGCSFLLKAGMLATT